MFLKGSFGNLKLVPGQWPVQYALSDFPLLGDFNMHTG